jgi:hypothetical protein
MSVEVSNQLTNLYCIWRETSVLVPTRMLPSPDYYQSEDANNIEFVVAFMCREVGRLNFCWKSPAQSFLATSHSVLIAQYYCFMIPEAMQLSISSKILVKVKVILRQTASRPVYLGVMPHLGPETRFSLIIADDLLKWAPSLSGGSFELLLVLASAVILGSELRWTHDHILLSQIRDPPHMEVQVPVFISPRMQLYPQELVDSFLKQFITYLVPLVVTT